MKASFLGRMGVALLVVVFLVCATAHAATEVDILSDGDTYVREDAPAANYGNSTTLKVKPSAWNYHYRAYIGFELSAVPGNAVIDSATLNLYLGDAPPNARTYSLYRAAGAWEESVLNWTNQPPVADSTNSTIIGTKNNVWRVWDVLSDVQDFISGSCANFGWSVRDSSENDSAPPGDEATFRSSEYVVNVSQRPFLLLVYHFCGDGVVDSDEECDGGPCCTSACVFRSSSEVCRGAADMCDEAEYCDGADSACPVDKVKSSTFTCRSSAGVCDLPENCDGVDKACPSDAKSVGVCRPSVGDCDLSEYCEGLGDDCPSDTKAPRGTSCEDGLWCSALDECDGGGGCVQAAARDCSGYSFSAVDACDHDPDGCVFTWDRRGAFVSVCDEGLDACTEGDPSISHSCDLGVCGGECDGSHSCVDKCKGQMRYFGGVCSPECGCVYEVENCSSEPDGWVGAARCDGFDLFRDWRTHFCDGGQCLYRDEERLAEDCGETAYVESPWVCEGGVLVRSVLPVLRGCDVLSESCFVRTLPYVYYAGGSCATATTTTVETTTTTTTSTTTTVVCEMKGNQLPCGEVTLSEVVAAINRWQAGDLGLGDVVSLINSWSNPETYPPS